MKNLLLLLLIFISIKSYGQIEVTQDSLVSKNTDKGIDVLEKQFDNYVKTDDVSPTKEPSKSYLSDYRPLRSNESKPLDFSLPPISYDPVSLIYTNPFKSRYPFADDYNMYAIYGLSQQTSITTLSSQEAYPTLGAIRLIRAQFNYRPTSWLIMSGGPYVSKYSVYGNHYNDVGGSGNMKFILHDRVRINVYGQYAAYAKANNTGVPVVGVYPQSYYGGTMEFKITERFGVEAGMVRELNPLNGKWENRPVISPVFYGK